jgi:hypothetical protein
LGSTACTKCLTAKKNPGFFTQTSHVMQHLLAWRLPQLSSTVNAAVKALDGCGEATTVSFISCGGLPRHGAIADAFHLAIGQETQQALAFNGRTANLARACGDRCEARRRAGCRRTDCQLGKCVSGLARRANEIPEAGAEFGHFYVRPNARVNRRRSRRRRAPTLGGAKRWPVLASALNDSLGLCACATVTARPTT